MSTQSISAETVRELLGYDPKTGELRWRYRPAASVQWNGKHAGKIAGCLRPDGYVGVRVNRRLYQAHRLVWLHVYGALPEADIDHINGIRNDNRLTNLRAVSRSVNQQNRRGGQRGSASRYLGVSWSSKRNKWEATIKNSEGTHRLGFFTTEEAASAVYLSAKKRLHVAYSPALDQPQPTLNGFLPTVVGPPVQSRCGVAREGQD